MRDGTDTAEMLELIGKVTASLSDRMDEHGKALEDMGERVEESHALIRERMPETPARIAAFRKELKGVHESLIIAQDSLGDAEHRARDAWERVEAKRTENRELQDALDETDKARRTWKRAVLLAVPVAVLLAGLLLPTLLGRHPLSCKAMLGTWHIEREKAFCFFVRPEP